MAASNVHRFDPRVAEACCSCTDVVQNVDFKFQTLKAAYKFHIFQLLHKRVFGIEEDEVDNHISMLERQTYFSGGFRYGQKHEILKPGTLTMLKNCDGKELAEYAPRLVLSRFSFRFGLISLAV